MALSVTLSNPSYYQDSGAPAISYQSISLNIYAGQFYLDSSNSDLYICINSTNQNNLIWLKVPNINQLPANQVNSDWNASSGLAQILNKPVASYSSPNFASVTAATQLSTTKDAAVNYVFPTALTSLLTNQTLTATLQYADDSGMSTNLVTVNVDMMGCSGLLNLPLSGRLQVSARIPAGKYRRVVLAQTGGATVPTTISSAQEVLL